MKPKYRVKIRKNCPFCNGARRFPNVSLDRKNKEHDDYDWNEGVSCLECNGTGKVIEEIEVLDYKLIL